ncbi:hypothetical protein J6500_12310 [Bradyrhizobium sp. WSM 1704]|uniref:hypothetical protein n=1 Tax=Bradyrhizobium semiaridum TaxID=2821404 RepID=UPI001CE32FEA|nr:hypothetical protein [Bradyrhizobium semiaridum]MCA6122671.1 hypothetical protein [Bradyrhizobium semiaridum]
MAIIGDRETNRAPAQCDREDVMIHRPDLDSYSLPARICLGVAIFSAALLVAAVSAFVLA